MRAATADGRRQPLRDSAPEAASGFDMRPVELLAVDDPEPRSEIRQIAVLGASQRHVALSTAARHAEQTGDSIFASSLANAFLCVPPAARRLGPAARPVSGARDPTVQGPVKDLLDLPELCTFFTDL